MRPLKALIAAAAVLAGCLQSGAVFAQRHWHGPRVGIGIHFGAPLYRPWYYAPPPYYYPPVVVAPAPPPVYIERPAPPPPAADWFYCPGAQGYYPYVRECPGGWQRVPAQPVSP
ncbi:MAG: hypothetical protein IT514_01175 [Burkholderiales bacterium]|nr:hypothetical protein [Burkholderiales bacterium]